MNGQIRTKEATTYHAQFRIPPQPPISFCGRRTSGDMGMLCHMVTMIVSSDRSSYSDDGLLYIYPSKPLFQIFTQSIDAIDVTSVTLSRLNSINAIDI